MSRVCRSSIINAACTTAVLGLLLSALLPHTIVGITNARGFVASSKARAAAATTAAAECRSHPNFNHAARPAERESRRQHRRGSRTQQSAAYCIRSTPWVLRLIGRCEVVAPATAVTAGARTATAAAKAPTRSFSRIMPIDGILAPVKEKIKMRGERDDESDTVLLYFSFGANMCPSILINKRGVRPFESFPAEAKNFATAGKRQKIHGTRDCGVNDDRPSLKDEEGAERGICLCFCHRAGYATLARTPGPPQAWEASPGAHGVLHAISSADLDKMSASETGYRKRLVEVETPAGERDVAVCFVSTPSQALPTSVPPTSRYLALLQDGAAHHGVDERYQSWLARLASVPPENEAMSPERMNTPSKIVTDVVVTAVAVAALGAAGAAIYPF